MALPGFIEYLFYGYEQREESGFFTPSDPASFASHSNQRDHSMTGGEEKDDAG